MNEWVKIHSFPPVAKLFVALFTTLMLLICFWATWIYVVKKGEVDEDHLPAYMSSEGENALTVEDEIEAIAEEGDAALAPIWDAEHAGEEEPFDSTELAIMEASAGADESYGGRNDEDEAEPESRLGHNLGLAHVHVNGQTLLFFALGAVFLFTSVRPRIKKIVLWAFGISIPVHAVGLSGEGYHWLFDDMLAVSGVLMLAMIAFMCLMIYIDLGRTPKKS